MYFGPAFESDCAFEVRFEFLMENMIFKCVRCLLTFHLGFLTYLASSVEMEFEQHAVDVIASLFELGQSAAALAMSEFVAVVGTHKFEDLDELHN